MSYLVKNPEDRFSHDMLNFYMGLNLFQYFSPYLSADMSKMAIAFNTTVLRLEDELMQLILDGQINARIDSHSKVCRDCH